MFSLERFAARPGFVTAPSRRRCADPATIRPRAAQLAPLPFTNALDRTLEVVMPLARHLPSWEPGHGLLSGAKQREVENLARRLRRPIDALTPAIWAHDAAATAEYDLLVQTAVDGLRSHNLRDGMPLFEAWDRCVYQDGAELSDDPDCPMPDRAHVLDTLDRLNRHAGNYERWVGILSPLLQRAARSRQQTPRLVDLAAGAGGFALALKRRLGDKIDVIATDLVPEYLDLGRRQAAEEGLAVRFATQDATALAPLGEAGVDVFTATQCLHHFSPGMAARMLGEALRAARVGVCFIDGERGAMPAALMSAFMAVYGRSWPVVHDTLVSFRRMYVAEEMRLLALLAPTGAARPQVQSGRLQPGHAYVILSREIP